MWSDTNSETMKPYPSVETRSSPTHPSQYGDSGTFRDFDRMACGTTRPIVSSTTQGYASLFPTKGFSSQGPPPPNQEMECHMDGPSGKLEPYPKPPDRRPMVDGHLLSIRGYPSDRDVPLSASYGRRRTAWAREWFRLTQAEGHGAQLSRDLFRTVKILVPRRSQLPKSDSAQVPRRSHQKYPMTCKASVNDSLQRTFFGGRLPNPRNKRKT